MVAGVCGVRSKNFSASSFERFLDFACHKVAGCFDCSSAHVFDEQMAVEFGVGQDTNERDVILLTLTGAWKFPLPIFK